MGQSSAINGCILSKFYIKPQLPLHSDSISPCCILSKFYIKPQLVRCSVFFRTCCILSKFYIKPQHWMLSRLENIVVSYRNSTSNHNALVKRVVSLWLYLIEILHQTTTANPPQGWPFCCILSKFYIKPQPVDA